MAKLSAAKVGYLNPTPQNEVFLAMQGYPAYYQVLPIAN